MSKNIQQQGRISNNKIRTSESKQERALMSKKQQELNKIRENKREQSIMSEKGKK